MVDRPVENPTSKDLGVGRNPIPRAKAKGFINYVKSERKREASYFLLSWQYLSNINHGDTDISGNGDYDMEPYPIDDLIITLNREGARKFSKVSFPIRYGRYSEILTPDGIF